jgi:aryl-alcohol dehydrogenase-like predicted oxidoreductase
MTKMEYRRLGRSGLRVSVLSFGSWVTFANADQIETAHQAAECLSAAKDAGVNFFDNAEVRRLHEALLGAARDPQHA